MQYFNSMETEPNLNEDNNEEGVRIRPRRLFLSSGSLRINVPPEFRYHAKIQHGGYLDGYITPDKKLVLYPATKQYTPEEAHDNEDVKTYHEQPVQEIPPPIAPQAEPAPTPEPIPTETRQNERRFGFF